MIFRCVAIITKGGWREWMRVNVSVRANKCANWNETVSLRETRSLRFFLFFSFSILNDFNIHIYIYRFWLIFVVVVLIAFRFPSIRTAQQDNHKITAINHIFCRFTCAHTHTHTSLLKSYTLSIGKWYIDEDNFSALPCFIRWKTRAFEPKRINLNIKYNINDNIHIHGMVPYTT